MFLIRSFKVNAKGKSLINVLDASVILGIAFVGFMIYTPQMTTIYEKYEIMVDLGRIVDEALKVESPVPPHTRDSTLYNQMPEVGDIG